MQDQLEQFKKTVRTLLKMMEGTGVCTLEERERPPSPLGANKKCPFCNEKNCQHARAVVDKPDRAQRVITKLKDETEELQREADAILFRGSEKPEMLWKEIDAVQEKLELIRGRKINIKQLSGYKKDVLKLGVMVK